MILPAAFRFRSCVLAGGFVVLVASGTAVGEILVQGRVQDNAGRPVAGALASIVDYGLSETADSSGMFCIRSSAVTAQQAMRPTLGAVRIESDALVLSGLERRRVRIELYSLAGRRLRVLFNDIVPNDRHVATRWASLRLAGGSYVCRTAIEGSVACTRVAIAGGRAGGESLRVAVNGSGALLKSAAAGDRLEVSLSGYQTAEVVLDGDTVLGLVVTLNRPGAVTEQPVSWSTRRRTLGATVCVDHKSSYYRWLGGSIKAYNNDCAQSQRREVEYTLITVSNGLIEVDVAPELGLRVLAARDKTVGGESAVDFFTGQSPILTNEWLRGHGGVEPSFPFFESGTSTLDQQGGYRVIEHPDGAVTVAMNMRMDHRQTEMDMAFLGKYGDRPLSAWVTVRPGRNLFEITYRAENHNPTRRSTRMWNNTFYPGGATSVLFPVYWAADHCVSDYWVVDGNPDNSHGSDFGLFPQYPFAGLWYASEGVNRLRICDPATAPGLKLYDGISSSYYEIWGSTNAIFEVPEGFVDAYEPLEMTHKYYVTRSIGEAAFANEHVAIALPAADRFEMTATREATVTVVDYQDRVVAAEQPIGPNEVVSGAFSGGLRVVLDGDTVFDGALPLVLDQSTAGLDSLQAWSALSWGTGTHDKSELTTADGLRYARNVEMEELGSKWWTLSAFASAWFDIAQAQQPGVPADQVLSVANTLYRLGRLDRAQLWARLVNFKEPSPQADHLLGLIAWEQGDTVDFGNAGLEANYHRALLAIGRGAHGEAVSLLQAYVKEYPKAFRPRLLLAYLTRDLALAAACSMENPGSPEALAVMKELGYAPAQHALSTLVDTATGSDVALNDFLAEITQGAWRHGRRYEYTHPSLANTFAFPEELK